MDVEYDLNNLSIIDYPDPRLRVRCQPVAEFNDELAALARRMFELMRAEKGVGIAAAQVGVSLRMLVMNAPGEEQDDLVFVNPVILEREGHAEVEEGCLSLPGINVLVRRAKRCRIEARDLNGDPISIEGEDLICRCWHHEMDHLDGFLIIDRMGPSDRIATRRTLKNLEQDYADARN